MHYFCTLFDSNYFSRGLAMYDSLSKKCDSFHLYIFAFDERCLSLLLDMKLPNVTVVSLFMFEDEKLLEVKSSRSTAEYCWTCTPSTIKYCIETFNLDSCTYLDADLYFFNNPAVLIEEMGGKSILITEHRYTKIYDQIETSGLYCVQFMTFKNDFNGMGALNWWRDACLEWCYNRHEDGKFGDQKYLDDWTSRFKGVHVLKHLGGGVAPWNIQQYELDECDFDLIFYHFHGLKFINDDYVDFGNYKLDENDVDILYVPYVRHLKEIISSFKIKGDYFDYNGSSKLTFSWKKPIRFMRRVVKGEYNIFYINKLLGDLDG